MINIQAIHKGLHRKTFSKWGRWTKKFEPW